MFRHYKALTATSQSFTVTGIEIDNTANVGAKEEYKPSYRDIPNTIDIKAAFNGFAYGGLYHLSIVNLDMMET